MSASHVTGAPSSTYGDRVLRSLVVQLGMRSASVKHESWKERVSILGLSSMSDPDGHRCMRGTFEERKAYAREFMGSLAKGLLDAAQRGEWSEDFRRVVGAGCQMAAISPATGAALFLEELGKALRTHVTDDSRGALLSRAIEATSNATNLLSTLLLFAEESGLRSVERITALSNAFTHNTTGRMNLTDATKFQALVTESMMRARIEEQASAVDAAPSAAVRHRRVWF